MHVRVECSSQKKRKRSGEKREGSSLKSGLPNSEAVDVGEVSFNGWRTKSLVNLS